MGKQNGATHFQLNRSVAQETVLVQLGTYGTVLGEYSDTRLVVRFDQRMDGLEQVRMDDENGKNATLVWRDDCFGRYSCICICCFSFFFNKHILCVLYSKDKLTFIYIASKGQGVWICFSLKVTPVVSKKDLC